jgi:protoheme IX farnesyltransferase
MIGEAAVSGTVSLETVVLFLIIFLWTPPHFWALALVKSGDYARAGIPMMPNVAGAESTRRQILGYTLVLAPCGLLPVVLGFGGLIYALVSLLGGVGMIALACQVQRRRDGDAAARAAQQLFAFSILYLFVLFAALLAEHGLGLHWPVPGIL